MLTTKDQLKIDIIVKLVAKLISVRTAVKLLGVSRATIFRYCIAYRKKGPLFVLHGNKGRPSHQAIDPQIKEKILNLIAKKYYDYNILHAWEKLAEEDDGNGGNLQVIVYKTLLGWCRDKNFVKRIRKRRKKVHRARLRMPNRGLMLQMDGSYHNWFGKEKSCLIAAIDDADNDVPYAEFFNWETTLNCMKVIKKIVEIKGAFKVLYVDRAGAFGGNKRTNFSQLEKACSELGISVVYANSGEAKGRIERLWKTLQGRLIPEMRLNNVTTREEANNFIQNIFIPNQYRKSFTLHPRSEESEYYEVNANLDEIFTVKETRRISSGQTFSWDAKKHIILSDKNLSNGILEVRTYPEGHSKFYYRGDEVVVELFEEEYKKAA